MHPSMTIQKKALNILGTRGLPGRHGGFETFAEHLALYLVEKGWHVRVYCQVTDEERDRSKNGTTDIWRGIERIHFAPRRSGPIGTIEFDLKCVLDVTQRDGIDLVLGYNTAVFNIIQRLRGRTVFMNMDGIEWRRDKWSFPAKSWLMINELIGANISSVAIADNPHIAKHIAARSFKNPTMIPYGADAVVAPTSTILETFRLQPDKYFISVARIEPENSTLEIVQAFSDANTGLELAVVGHLDDRAPYHQLVQAAANANVKFLGAIYDQHVLGSLRHHARAHLHGHKVGGTNPSLVEAMAAKSAIIAHDNPYNRWTAGNAQFYFTDTMECKSRIETLSVTSEALTNARSAAFERHKAHFTWSDILGKYEALFEGKTH